MSLVTIDNTTLTSIANAIREKNGTTDAYKPSEMPTAISNIETGGGSGGTYAPRWIRFASYTGNELDYELENLVATNLIKATSMFEGCSLLLSVNLLGFGNSPVTSVESMFRTCSNLKSVDLSNFVTPDLTYCANMFYSCKKLTDVNISRMVTTKVTSMAQMFYGAVELTSLDLSNFETPALTNTSKMFYNCSKLMKIDMRKFDFSNVTTYTDMFYNVSASCEIIVKDDAARDFLLTVRSAMKNIKTVAEL